MSELTVVGRGPHHLSWRPADEGYQRRTSHAVTAAGRTWLVDPIDGTGLDDLFAGLGELAGIVVTLGRHRRDTDAIAARLGLSIWADAALGRLKVESPVTTFSGELDGGPLVSISLRGRGTKRWWKEAALWWPAERLLLVSESVGTPGYYRLGDERLGLHPMRRSRPPAELAEIAPGTLLLGHGDEIAADAAPLLGELLTAGPSRRRPFWFFRSVRRTD